MNTVFETFLRDTYRYSCDKRSGTDERTSCGTVTVLFLCLVVVAVLAVVVSVVPTMDVRRGGRTLSVLLPSSDSLFYHVSALRGHYHRRFATCPVRRNYHSPLFDNCIPFRVLVVTNGNLRLAVVVEVAVS